MKGGRPQLRMPPGFFMPFLNEGALTRETIIQAIIPLPSRFRISSGSTASQCIQNTFELLIRGKWNHNLSAVFRTQLNLDLHSQ